MTFAIYIVLIMGMVIGGLNVLPDASSLGTNFTNSIQIIIGYSKAFNFLLPVNETLICVGLVLVYEFIFWSWHWTIKIIKFFRGHSDGS